jgi:CRP-like cAMP-binding protein
MNNSQKPPVSRDINNPYSGMSKLLGKICDNLIDFQTPVTYNPGAVLSLQGSAADLLFCILSGFVKVYCLRADGRRILISLAGPAEIVGHVHQVDVNGRYTHLFELEASTKSSVVLFPRERVVRLLNSLEPSELIEVIESLHTAWSSVAAWFVMFFEMTYEERLETVLRDLAARFGVEDARGVLIVPELSHSDLAEMIGSSRPMVSRLIAEMTSQGYLLRQQKRYLLLKRFFEVSFPTESDGCAEKSMANPAFSLLSLRNATRCADERARVSTAMVQGGPGILAYISRLRQLTN